MIAVTIGTTSWRATDTLGPNEVQYVGPWITDTDGLTPLMVWDAGLGNVRPMTAGEIAALPAQRLAAARQSSLDRLTTAIQSDQEVALLRALLLSAVDALNAERATVNAMLSAVAAATSLADLKTRYAAIQALPTLTRSNVVASITSHINAGDADT